MFVNCWSEVCLLFVLCACCLLLACLLAGLLACLLVVLPALSFNLMINFSPLQNTRRLSVRSDPHAESIAPALMPASYAVANAEPEEHRADRTQFLHIIAYSGVGAPQVHKSTSDSCSMGHNSNFQTYQDAVSPLSETSSMSTKWTALHSTVGHHKQQHKQHNGQCFPSNKLDRASPGAPALE